MVSGSWVVGFVRVEERKGTAFLLGNDGVWLSFLHNPLVSIGSRQGIVRRVRFIGSVGVLFVWE